ncbi:APH(3') family aminoglycoside O-phosphotransferase [Sphingomonas lenta]|uniref:Aminoglycoside 3'-phosphotransferase n=2 Tax=Sphingomonas lenta TaxID=1141887 RepID=A0A2A2SDY7_9SPHN|nr:APH(3') family aminoglycoside O-phosphotransferase [Sphingomonas lenta]
MAPLVAGRRWTRDLDGESGGDVHRLNEPGRAPLYLKHGTGDVAVAITEEMARLRWLAGRIPVPEVVRFVCTPEEAWLLSTAMPGLTAYQRLVARPERRRETVAALAAFLRSIHELPVDECPFNAQAPLRMAGARRRIETGWTPPPDDPERDAWNPEPVWRELTALLPLSFERVVTHGDFSVGNVLIEDGRVTGCIDVGRVGVADPYQDLAILWDNLGEFGEDLQRELFRAYGIAEPDQRRLRFHLLLDELF